MDFFTLHIADACHIVISELDIVYSSNSQQKDEKIGLSDT